MTLREFLDHAGLMPEVQGITGLMDGQRRHELLSRMPAKKTETRFQGALMETLYPLVELGDVALSFTSPSCVFLIETTMKSEVAFDLESALEYVPFEYRAELAHEYETRLHMIAQGKGGELVF
jgi:hypothetical protein